MDSISQKCQKTIPSLVFDESKKFLIEGFVDCFPMCNGHFEKANPYQLSASVLKIFWIEVPFFRIEGFDAHNFAEPSNSLITWDGKFNFYSGPQLRSLSVVDNKGEASGRQVYKESRVVYRVDRALGFRSEPDETVVVRPQHISRGSLNKFFEDLRHAYLSGVQPPSSRRFARDSYGTCVPLESTQKVLIVF